LVAGAVLVRCQSCQRLQAEGPQCVECGSGLPEVERLDARAVQLRQRAVVALLVPAERAALAAVVSGLGLVGSWWRVRVVRELFVVLAAEHRLADLVASGASRTSGLRQAASELGVKFETLRDRVNAVLLDRGAA